MRHRDLRSQKSNIDSGNRKSALFENVDIGIGEFILDFSAALPPPANDVNAVTVFGEQIGVGLRVMLIPSFRLPCFQGANGGFVCRLIRREEWRDEKDKRSDEE